MEEAWNAKCSSGWPSTPAVPVFTPATAGSCNQINLNGQQFYHPDVMQAANLGNSQVLQEPLLSRIFNKDLRKSGNLEAGNSFLSLLSGRSYNLPGELLPPLNQNSERSKLPISDRNTFRQSSTCSFSSNFIPPLSKYHCNDAIFNGVLPSFLASRPVAADLSKDIQPLIPHSDILGSSKAVSRQSFEDMTRGIGVSSRGFGSSSLSCSAFLHQNNQAFQSLPSNANVHDIISPLLFRDHPRVLCMNTAGELFVDDMGFLGVLCSCHSLPMSVAKFCQHSGLTSTIPCDVIKMENGMTLAQWCKMCFGNLTLGDRRGPDQSNFVSGERGYIGSNASSFSSLPKSHRTINTVKAYSEFERSGELKNDALYTRCPNLMGKVSTGKPVNSDMDYKNEERNSGWNGLLHLTGLNQGAIPITSENTNLQFVRETPEFLNTQRLPSTPNKREPNAASQLFASNTNLGARSRSTSASHAPAGLKKNLIHGKNISTRGSSSNDVFVVDKNGSDLRLGQPSQDTHSSLSCFPTDINLSLPPVCFSSELQQQNKLSDITDFARETKRARLNRPSPLPETSTSVRRAPHPESRTTFSFHNSESADLTKDSSISLFLSHLTGGTGLSDCSNRVLDVTSTVASSINCDLISSRENPSCGTRNEFEEIGNASSFNEIDYFNSKGTFPNGVSDSSTNMENIDVHSKQIEDRKLNQPFINRQSFHSFPANMGKSNMGKSSLFSNQPFRSLHKGTDSENSNKNGKMEILEDCCHLSNIIVRGSEIRATQCGGSPGCLELEAPITLSSTNSNHISETNCLSCKENVKFQDHLMDGNSRFLASSSHECLMAKHEQLSAFKRKSQHGKLCCLSAMESHRNSCTDDLVGPKNVTYFNSHQSASDLCSGSNCHCNNPFGDLYCERGSGASYKCYNCAASAQKMSPCSTFSSHHICATRRHLCFRPREISSGTSLDNEYEMCIYKRGGHPVYGNCCCATFSKCLVGCSFNGALNAPYITNDQNANRMLNPINPTLEKVATFQSGRKNELEQSRCCKKTISLQNNQTGFWRDASSKIIGYSAAIPENHAETSEVACKKLDGTSMASMSLDAPEIFDRSRSSAPTITEVSVEVNKRDSENSKVNSGMILHYSLFDEGSGIEKCSSTDEGPNTKKCEVVDTSGMSSHSCDNIAAEFKFSGSSKKKRIRNKITTECTEQENSQRHQLTRMCKLRKRKEPSNSDEHNDAVPDSEFLLAHSEPPGSIDEVKCLLPLSERVGISTEPENAVEGTCIISRGSSNIKQKQSDFPSSKFVSLKNAVEGTCIISSGSSSIKQKRSDFSSSKFVSLKKLGDQILLSNNLHLPEESKNSVPVVEKVDFSLYGKQDPAKRLNHLNGERPRKYMSLSSIVDSRNHESGTSIISKKPVVCGNSGIISSGELNVLQKSPKIVPLNLILQKSRRCTSNSEVEPKTSLISKMECTGVKDKNCSDFSSCKLPDGSESPYLGRSKVGSNKQFMSGRESHLSKLDSRKGVKGGWYAEIRSRNISMNSKADKDDRSIMHKKRNSRSEPSSFGVALCCVCGNSNKETTNCLLECNRCLISVHQACYGISEVPKDVWYCRPCKRNSRNIELLQSEIDEVDHYNIGIYGKCMLNARSDYHTDSPPMNAEAPSHIIKEWSCARTEGFKGRGKGRFPNYQIAFDDGDGCIVSQVQINAWVHINGQKSCIRGGVEPACSDVEHDLRKEYIRYKHSKGWKHLVVYNSSIHDLGLYTSRFITRGAMVVEYVGEVVGLRVADKREIEYQSGRRLQCKSACYFFRIDREQIIDATRKGGIARFVNHSCLPNCVAKVISIKNEKKVVFFAERDINPGEEVTYDYHFNREDEGKKIPCFCNSKNCRRFLN